jgi:mannose-6-phosphate isomerase-like protein (cupin superfamily)
MASPKTSRKPAVRGAEKKEAFHREAEGRIESFAFKRPDNLPPGTKATHYLAKSDLVFGSIQIVPEGGDNNLHYHPGDDGFWMVLKGRVRFYGPEQKVIGEYGPNEGLFMPRNARYWFETADKKQELHILHVSAKTQTKIQNRRVNVDPPNDGYKNAIRLNWPAGQEPPKSFD